MQGAHTLTRCFRGDRGGHIGRCPRGHERSGASRAGCRRSIPSGSPTRCAPRR